MCKVSTLRSVEPPCTNVFCKAEQLPKINRACMIKQSLVYIEEDVSGDCQLEFSLPQLKENHPPTAVLGHVESNFNHDIEPTDIVKAKMNHEDVQKSRRPSTPFVTCNLHQKSPLQSSGSPAIPLPNDKKDILKRPKLQLSLSYPGANHKVPTKMNNMTRIPTPPKSPPKNRPMTPFLLTRSRSFDSRKSRNSLHTLDETEMGVECLEKAKPLPLNIGGKQSFVARKIDRDKAEELPVYDMPENDMILAGQGGKGCKIRMDMTAFAQWIEEHRLP